MVGDRHATLLCAIRRLAARLSGAAVVLPMVVASRATSLAAQPSAPRTELRVESHAASRTAIHAARPREAPTRHRLMPSPSTVAYGYYWADATPVLRVASGDEITIGTLLTSTPQRLEAAGVKPEDVEQSLRAIVDSVKDRGPGGHILVQVHPSSRTS